MPITLPDGWHSHYAYGKRWAKHLVSDKHIGQSQAVIRAHNKDLEKRKRHARAKSIEKGFERARVVDIHLPFDVPHTLGLAARVAWNRWLTAQLIRHQAKFHLAPHQVKEGFYDVMLPRLWRKIRREFRKTKEGIWEPR